MAKVNRTIIGYNTGFENTIDGFGTFFMIFGILGAVACIVALGASDPTNYSYITLAFASLMGAFFPFAVLRGIAEVIRVQKKNAGLPYAGTIKKPNDTEAASVSEYACAACGTKVIAEVGWKDNKWQKKQTSCSNCKEPLEWGD